MYLSLPLKKSYNCRKIFVMIGCGDAKGRKVSRNSGNFPWKVLGILKGWKFSEILGIFNCDLFSTFYETVCTKIKLNLFCTNNSR